MQDPLPSEDPEQRRADLVYAVAALSEAFWPDDLLAACGMVPPRLRHAMVDLDLRSESVGPVPGDQWSLSRARGRRLRPHARQEAMSRLRIDARLRDDASRKLAQLARLGCVQPDPCAVALAGAEADPVPVAGL